MLHSAPVVRVSNLRVHYAAGRTGFWGQHKRVVRAVDGVTLSIGAGETLGLVGESGSGKTTTGRAVLRLVDATGGSIEFLGEDITHVKGERLRQMRQHMQMVFQDPYGSLNPRKRILEIMAEPLIVHGRVRTANEARDIVTELLRVTGLPPDAATRYPHAFSGGQRQRIGIARALALHPELLVVDEPVAALDTSVQAQVVNLLQDLQEQFGLTYLFIAHDLAVVRHIADRVAIMYAGQIVEVASSEETYGHPRHPYTQALLASVPVPDPVVRVRRERAIEGSEIADPADFPPGCRFHTRCPHRRPGRCDTEMPALREVSPGHVVACHFAEEIAEGRVPR